MANVSQRRDKPGPKLLRRLSKAEVERPPKLYVFRYIKSTHSHIKKGQLRYNKITSLILGKPLINSEKCPHPSPKSSPEAGCVKKTYGLHHQRMLLEEVFTISPTPKCRHCGYVVSRSSKLSGHCNEAPYGPKKHKCVHCLAKVSESTKVCTNCLQDPFVKVKK